MTVLYDDDHEFNTMMIIVTKLMKMEVFSDDGHSHIAVIFAINQQYVSDIFDTLKLDYNTSILIGCPFLSYPSPQLGIGKNFINSPGFHEHPTKG